MSLPLCAEPAMAEPAAGPQPAVMILLDVNHSLLGVASAVRNAALAYESALPSDVRVGLITFSNNGYQVLLSPTTDRTRFAAAMGPVSVAQRGIQSFYSSVGIYGALAKAASDLLGDEPSRILVLSDAENLDGAAPSSSIPTDVAFWRLDADDYVSKLQELASDSNGRYVNPARVARLATAAFPRALPQTGKSSAKRRARPRATVRVAAATQPWALLGGAAAVFAALFVAALALFGGIARSGKGRDLATRIEKYGPAHQAKATAVQKVSADPAKLGGVAVSVANRLMPSGTHDRLSKRLSLAGLTRQPGEWAVFGGCTGLAVAAILSLVTSYVVIGIIGGVLIGWLIMRLALSLLILRRRATFADQLADVLQLIASSLKSGFSLAQALDAAVRYDNQPAAGEFSRALAEARIGANLEDALEAIATRMDSDDLRWAVMAIRIQQGTGGNLAEVLLTIVATIRERGFLRRQIRSLSAEGRLTAYVLIALPILMAVLLFVISPQYMHPLYSTHGGLLLLTLAAALVVIGTVIMRRMIKVEV